jgi:ornithine--oxo-acid transaminase
MPTSKAIMAQTETWGAHNYKPLPVVLAHGEGVWVEDLEGKRYLDFLSCYSALNQGHRHPRIIKALKDQADKITLTSRAFYNDQLGPLCEELAAFTGHEMVLPMNSGAEAGETALKLARKWAYQVRKLKRYEADIIVCANNFHGRTISWVSCSTEKLYRDDFGPFTPGFTIVPYGDAAAIEKAIRPTTAAVCLEPIQGEAGVVLPPPGFLKKVSDLCRTHNLLFIADEVQTGFGRTGAKFACDHEQVRPDLFILGKALGGGVYPISAVTGASALLGLFAPGEHGSTFGGNPLACAVAREALRVIIDEKLPQRSAELGAYFMDQLRTFSSPHVKEIRGKGLFTGVELHKSAGGARRFCEALMEKGMLCKETHEHVIRFAPPLTITQGELDWALERIEPVLKMK